MVIVLVTVVVVVPAAVLDSVRCCVYRKAAGDAVGATFVFATPSVDTDDTGS